MSQVDPGDDSIKRFIVRHYRYDEARHERRHVVVAAFDNEREFRAAIARIQAEIVRRRERGDDADPREHASGVFYEPGYLRRAVNGHLVSRAIKHGVGASLPEDLELPSNVSVMRFVREPA